MFLEIQSKLRRLVRKVRLGHEPAHAATSVIFFAAFVGEKASAGHTAFVDGPIRFIPPLPEEISPAAEENLDLVGGAIANLRIQGILRDSSPRGHRRRDRGRYG